MEVAIVLESCGGYKGIYPVWFTIEGDNTWKTLSVSNAQVWKFEGACGALTCLSSDSTFYAESGNSYFFNINRSSGEARIILTCSEAEECVENITFSNEMILTGIHEASKDIITSGAVTLDNKGPISLKAGNSILLTAGFFANSGTTFTAQIQACESSLQQKRKPLQSNNILQTPTVIEFSISPNPFSKFSRIDYNLQETGTINLDIYNMNGQLLKSLINSERQERGNYSYELNVEELQAGMYIVVLSTEKERLNKKIILLN